MSKLVEELRKYVELKRSSTMRVTRTEAVELLAHIDRLQSECDELKATVTALGARLAGKASDSYVERLEANQIPEGCVAVSERELLRVYLTGYWEDEISKTAKRLEAATHGEGE